MCFVSHETDLELGGRLMAQFDSTRNVAKTQTQTLILDRPMAAST